MALEQFRTKDELARAQWAETFTSVAKGKLYTSENDPLSPFPLHKYFANKLLGKQIKMLQLIVGAALVEHFVADTLTEYKLTVGEKEGTDQEQEIRILAQLDSVSAQYVVEDLPEQFKIGSAVAIAELLKLKLPDNRDGLFQYPPRGGAATCGRCPLAIRQHDRRRETGSHRQALESQ